jgi:hypothetical protein
MSMKKSLLSVLVPGVLAAVGSLALGQDKGAPAAKAPAHKAHAATHVILNASDLKWGDAPPVFPPGAKMAVLQGDPSKAGPVRLKAGDGYKVAAHWHPAAENLTVISGTFYLGTGDKLDEAKGTAMTAGAFASMPARMHHFAWFKGDTEVQVHGMGPFQLTYVNPADDPTQGKK